MWGFSFLERLRDSRRYLDACCAVWLEEVAIAFSGVLDTHTFEWFVRLEGFASADETLGATNPEVDGPVLWDGGAALAAAASSLCVGHTAAGGCGTAPWHATLAKLLYGRYDTRLRASLNELFCFTLIVKIFFLP